MTGRAVLGSRLAAALAGGAVRRARLRRVLRARRMALVLTMTMAMPVAARLAVTASAMLALALLRALGVGRV
jgi:hypothetical protein